LRILMSADIFWIDGMPAGRLGIMPCPSGGESLEQDIRLVKEKGAEVLVSLLEDDEIRDFGLTQEESACRDRGIECVRFPIKDRSVPPTTQVTAQQIQSLTDKVVAGKSVVVHCRMGVGRSSLVAAAMMTLLGVEAGVAFERIQAARSTKVPDTSEQ